jgi:hypothetical protein
LQSFGTPNIQSLCIQASRDLVFLSFRIPVLYGASSAAISSTRIISPSRMKRSLLKKNTQFVSRSKHTVSVIKTSKVMLYKEIIPVLNLYKLINVFCWENTEFVNVKPGGTQVTTGL